MSGREEEVVAVRTRRRVKRVGKARVAVIVCGKIDGEGKAKER